MSDFRMRVPTAEIEPNVAGGVEALPNYTADPPVLSGDNIGVWTTFVTTTSDGLFTLDPSAIFSSVITVVVTPSLVNNDLVNTDSVENFGAAVSYAEVRVDTDTDLISIASYDKLAALIADTVCVTVYGVLL